MALASLANVARVSSLRTCVSTKSVKYLLNSIHAAMSWANSIHESAFPLSSFVLKLRSKFDHCVCGLPLLVGVLCAVAAS